MVKIRISPTAYLKMQSLVMGFDKEVGWFGTYEEVGELDFRIKDILVFPQYTSGCFVDDEQDNPLEFREWLNTLSDKDYNSRRLWGHSHVNMSTFPSGTDSQMFRRFAQTSGAAEVNRFAITVIANKKGEMNWWCYDGKTEKEYSNKDIDMFFEIEEGLTNIDWFDDVKTLVKDLTTRSSSSFLFPGKPTQAVGSTCSIVTKNQVMNNMGKDKVMEEKKAEDKNVAEFGAPSYISKGGNVYPLTFDCYDDEYYNWGGTAISPEEESAASFPDGLRDFKVYIDKDQNTIFETNCIIDNSETYPVVIEDLYQNRYAIGITEDPIEKDNPLADNDSLAMALLDSSLENIDCFIVNFADGDEGNLYSDYVLCPETPEEVEALMGMKVRELSISEDTDFEGKKTRTLWALVEENDYEHK